MDSVNEGKMGIPPCSKTVHVNSATAAELEQIKGVGTKYANIILALREASGNLNCLTLETIIKRKFSHRELLFLDFSP